MKLLQVMSKLPVRRSYVTHSPPSTASIVRGPVHPLSPPQPPSAPGEPHLDDPQIIHHPDRASLTIHSQALQINHLSLSYLLLRDLCQAPHSVDPRTHQKLFKPSDVPPHIRPLSSTVLRDTNGRPTHLSITWPSHLNQKPDHSSHYSFEWLKKFSQPTHLEVQRHRLEKLKPTLWISNPSKRVDSDSDAAELNWIERLLSEKKEQLIFNYGDLVEKGLEPNHNLQRDILEKLNEFGLVLFDGLKSSQDPNQFQEEDELKLQKLIQALGIDIRRTFYGDLWDVFSAGQQAKNVANTNLPLEFHMDLVHFENPPRFQFLHCLKNQVEGGRSGFADSYSVAYRLLQEDPEAFKILSKELVGFEYINDNHHTHFKHPTIQLKNGSDEATMKALMKDANRLQDVIQAVNYSPPFQAPFYHLLGQGADDKRIVNVYKALQKFESFFYPTKKNAYNPFTFETLLKPGQVVAFDNRRILHARSGFSALPHATHPPPSSSSRKFDQVDRWLKGAYVDGDSVWDRIRILNS